MNHTLRIVAGVAAVVGHAVPAAAGHEASPMADKRGREPVATEEEAAPAAPAAPAACFDVDMVGLSAQRGRTAPFDGIAVARLDEQLIVVAVSAVTTNDLSMGHIEATSHTLTFPSDPGRPWDGAVVVTVDDVDLVPLTPGVHPLVSVFTAVNGASGVIRTTAGSFVDLTDPAGGRASWIVEGRLCFGAEP